jgi:hypothetical protein
MNARCSLPIVLVVMLIASIAEAQPVVRVNVRPAGRHLVGQQVQIDVQVLVPNFFMSAPQFPTIDIPGAVVTMPDETGLNLSETIRGESYAGIQKTYVFVAQTAGKYTLPPAAITFSYALEPGKPTGAKVTLPPTVIEIEWPAGKAPPPDGSSALVSRITIEQTLDRDPGTLHVGEALTRTIATTAARTQAMFIPPPDFTAPDGVRMYRKDPVLSDEREDRVGLVAGHRTDRVTYTFDRPGTYQLPALDVKWFNAQANREETARADAVNVTVAAAVASAAIAPEPPPPPVPEEPANRFRIPLLATLAIVALLVAWALRHVMLRGLRHVLAWCALGWAALRRDRARHLPPLNPVTLPARQQAVARPVESA